MPSTLSRPTTHSTVLGPPRFSLRTMLMVVSALCCVFALMAAAGVIWSVALLLVIALAGAHVLGNSLGTKLRDEATRQVYSELDTQGVAPCPSQLPIVLPPRLAKQTRLHRTVGVTSIAAAGVGGELGGMLAAYTYPESSVAAVALGVVSMAVLGGLAGFATSSFLSVARQAFREATANGGSVRDRSSS